jgi:hypothetical protein
MGLHGGHFDWQEEEQELILTPPQIHRDLLNQKESSNKTINSKVRLVNLESVPDTSDFSLVVVHRIFV